MQPLTIGPRSAYTADQITALIRDTPSPEIDSGLELIDMNLEVVDTLTTDFLGGSVVRDSYATLHGSATLELGRRLDWGTALVRPFATVDGVRFDQGAYFTEVPVWAGGASREFFSVQGQDILSLLADRVGAAYAVAAGAPILTEVAAILTRQGFRKFAIDPSRASAVMPSARVWPMDDNTTWLTIVNDLLAAVGYQGIWSDWTGMLRCEVYRSPVERGSEWTYETTSLKSQLPIERTGSRDLYNAPNRWIAVRRNNIEGAAPVEGDGVYTYVNQSTGPTSVEARGGRVITAPLISIDAADQAALVAAVQARAAADMSSPVKYELSLPSPGQPLSWHMDRVKVIDPEIGLADVLVTKWTYHLAPSKDDMPQLWTVLND